MCIAANETMPNNPKKLDTITVNILIGICKPIKPPKTLKKNKNKTPITILTVPLPSIRIDTNGVIINDITNKINKIVIICELNIFFSVPSTFLLLNMS